MNKYAVFHISDTPWAYARDPQTLTLRLRTAASDIRRVTVHYKDRYDWYGPFCVRDLETVAAAGLFTYWSCDIRLERKRFRYFFELEDAAGEVSCFDERGWRGLEESLAEGRAFQYAYIGEADVYEGRENLTDAIVYQIFPERFHNGDAANDPPHTKPWGGVPGRYSSFGGDLPGIIGKLDYLSDLGITLIYLTPVFLSASNHKYNISDYYKIDPQFGTLDDARTLVRRAHELGIQVYFDAVFNHTGSDFFAFADVLKNQENSPYFDWYHIDSLPVSFEASNYYTFANLISTMPKLRTDNPRVRDYFFDVGRYWIREIGIDGWRLDVCDEVDHAFWQGFRRACLAENPQAALVGEIMHESSAFLKGNELDSIMNYPFKYAMTDYFARRTTSLDEFMDFLAANRVLYMDQITRQMWNLLDSHDTARFITDARGQRDRLALAQAFQFLYIGIPYIYYGDEVGLDGGHDPYCRRCMPWAEKDQDQGLHQFVKSLIALRKSSPAFSRGTFRELDRANGCILFQRQYEDEIFICAFNNSDEARSIGWELEDLTEVTPGNPGKFIESDRISLEPMGFRVFKKEVSR